MSRVHELNGKPARSYSEALDECVTSKLHLFTSAEEKKKKLEELSKKKLSSASK